ncbi:MAG: hypothetical protein CVT75_05245 [Alphaproteobacteria bacterium HGW-Alphaproteobacteria-14]|nr:MAG: hypothetical protein CVT75_05245 [Alphaproteobacteria bacterium HGW-Alphaproteobacteria-14]
MPSRLFRGDPPACKENAIWHRPQCLPNEMARPVPDTAMIQAIKKQKLRLKEEIASH